jgi:TatD DNase family protein
MFINVHTHQLSTDALAVYNLLWHEAHTVANVPKYTSVGIHPWYINESTLEYDLANLQTFAHKPNIIAIGECGLDRITTIPLTTQRYIFEQQLYIAQTLQKPLIVHCVRAFDELFALLNKTKPTIPIIIHGYNNNTQILSQLIKKGCYISLGKALKNEQSSASKAIRHIPLDRLFLETDDADIPISSIFAVASEQLGLEPQALVAQIEKNFSKVFFERNGSK